MGIAERITIERKRLGLSQADFASKAGVSLSSQKRYEKGQREPDSSYLFAIDAIGVDGHYLTFGTRIDDYQSNRYTAMEWLLMELSDALALDRNTFSDAIDKLESAVPKMVDTDDSSELTGLAKSLVCKIFDKSPVLDRRVREMIDDLHIDEYSGIVERFEEAQRQLRLEISPKKKAQSISMLWRVLRSGGKVDPIMLEEAVKLACS